ncbi:MAG: DUF5333 family protein [Pseudomonadota bacterium]
MQRKLAIILLSMGVLFLVACQSTVSSEPVPQATTAQDAEPKKLTREQRLTEFPRVAHEFVVSREIAEFFGGNYEELKFSESLAIRQQYPVVQELKAQGYDRHDISYFTRNIAARQVVLDMLEYFKSNNIDVNDKQAVCEAGRLEMIRGSQIGLMLEER